MKDERADSGDRVEVLCPTADAGAVAALVRATIEAWGGAPAFDERTTAVMWAVERARRYQYHYDAQRAFASVRRRTLAGGCRGDE
jgi:hypothetical protein